MAEMTLEEAIELGKKAVAANNSGEQIKALSTIFKHAQYVDITQRITEGKPLYNAAGHAVYVYGPVDITCNKDDIETNYYVLMANHETLKIVNGPVPIAKKGWGIWCSYLLNEKKVTNQLQCIGAEVFEFFNK